MVIKAKGFYENDVNYPVRFEPSGNDFFSAGLNEADLMRRLLELPDTSSPRGRRDKAILELAYGLGLRLAEIVGLDLGHLDLPDGQVFREGAVVGDTGFEPVTPCVSSKYSNQLS